MCRVRVPVRGLLEVGPVSLYSMLTQPTRYPFHVSLARGMPTSLYPPRWRKTDITRAAIHLRFQKRKSRCLRTLRSPPDSFGHKQRLEAQLVTHQTLHKHPQQHPTRPSNTTPSSKCQPPTASWVVSTCAASIEYGASAKFMAGDEASAVFELADAWEREAEGMGARFDEPDEVDEWTADVQMHTLTCRTGAPACRFCASLEPSPPPKEAEAGAEDKEAEEETKGKQGKQAQKVKKVGEGRKPQKGNGKSKE